MLFRYNHVIQVYSYYAGIFMLFMCIHVIRVYLCYLSMFMLFEYIHVIHVYSCYSCLFTLYRHTAHDWPLCGAQRRLLRHTGFWTVRLF